MALDKNYSQPSDEIDLRELCITLWQSKALILSITVVITCIAAAYAFLSTPIYETSARLLPPKTSDLASYNSATQLTGDAISGIVDQGSSRPMAPGIRELTPKAAYNTFLQQLDSDSTKLKFFDKYYLPAYSKENTEAEQQKLWKQLNSELKINLPKKVDDVVTTVLLEGPNPQTIAEWTNHYIALAAEATQKGFLQDLSSEVEVRSKGIEDQIATLRKVAKTQRDARIARVESALAIAKSIGLEAPPPGSSLIAINSVNSNEQGSFVNGSMMYLRGTKALTSELEQLTTRKNDDAYIPELSNLLKKQNLLASINLNPKHFTVVDIDRVASISETPIKPRKVLVLILGLLLGLILGGLAAITHKALSRT